jgi:hypothetical protein
VHWDSGIESYSRHGCISEFLAIVLSYEGRGPATGRSPAIGVLPICMKGFIASEVNFVLELKETIGPNP